MDNDTLSDVLIFDVLGKVSKILNILGDVLIQNKIDILKVVEVVNSFVNFKNFDTLKKILKNNFYNNF